ncbi:MAG TPA: FAD-binding protein [Candidatus Paceibacterota bacterium]
MTTEPDQPYKTSGNFSPHDFDQSDFGGIYRGVPKITESPTNIEELAKILKGYHDRDIAVKIRNTGHSTNGQTITNGVQISLSNIQNTYFDEEKMEVTVGAGVSWDLLY